MTQRFALAHHPFHFFCALCSPISTILALIMRTKETKACVFNSNSAVHLFLSNKKNNFNTTKDVIHNLVITFKIHVYSNSEINTYNEPFQLLFFIYQGQK